LTWVALDAGITYEVECESDFSAGRWEGVE
jgi:hypothetical protein